MPKTKRIATRSTRDAASRLDLEKFLPYRLALLAEEVSTALAGIYAERFQLSRQQWRILAVLGTVAEFDTSGIGRATTLDKMQVSRALQQLEHRKLIVRQIAEYDRRSKIVRLTDKGRQLFRQIEPLVLAREAEILRGLSPKDAEAFVRMVSELLAALRATEPAGADR